MTNSKVRNSDSAYSIRFSKVLLKLFTSLINTADKDIYNIFNSFLFPYYFYTNLTNKQTNTHTNKHNSSFLIKIWLYKIWEYSIGLKNSLEGKVSGDIVLFSSIC